MQQRDDDAVVTAEQRTPRTIRDVARAAGVSVGTASKALNGRGMLREETRERVQAAAIRLGFRPNFIAQSLTRGRSYTIGLLTSDSYGRFSSPLLAGIEDALGAAHLSIFLCNTRNDPTCEREHIESLLTKRVDGIIVTGSRTDPRTPIDVGTTGMPVIYAYAQVSAPGALCLIPDDAHGGHLAAEHLLRLGRRRLAHITGPRDFEAVHLRIGAMRETLAAYGASISEDRILFDPGIDSSAGRIWREAWGYRAVDLLQDQLADIDALFCGNDQLARGAIDALHERGVRVPDDIAVVGFDNWELICTDARPPLTSVDMNLHDLGVLASKYLINVIDGERPSGVIRHPCTLEIRASCGAASVRDRGVGRDDGIRHRSTSAHSTLTA